MVDEKTPLIGSLDNGNTPVDVGFSPGQSHSGENPKELLMVPVKGLFRFYDNTDVILMILGTIGAISYGVISPAQFILMGSLTDDFVDFVQCVRNNCSELPDLEDSMTKVALWYIGIAFLVLFTAWAGMALWGLSAERQVHKMRLAMFRNIIRQEVGWFDTHSSGELGTRFTSDLNTIADGMGSKFGRLMFSMTAFVSAYILAFNYVWQMTLVIMATLPIMTLSAGIVAKIVSGFTAKELNAYAKAGGVAEQTISSIRTVAAFGGEETQTDKYDVHLVEACKFGMQKGLGIGVGLAIFQLCVLANYALSLWYGIKMVREHNASSGDVMSVFFMVLLGSTTLGQAGPCVEALAAARGAAYTIFSIIDRESAIDPSSNAGLKPATVQGDVEFANIDFVYPSRPSIQILRDFSLKIPSGKRVALVGESGCGKSTVVKLLLRFYDPKRGTVKLDGQDIKDINVSHLRRLIGVVNQEPVLFATTIAENIAYGREGVTQQEIEEAAKMANAHNFIMQFPQGYNTLCGERGTQMSGGQKQRISIARALVRNPKMLLLDEATSALDTESEAVVQEALDRAGKGRTTIIIAHRLSTVRNADMIVALKEGHVEEIGTHDELIALNGIYKTLVRLQKACDDDKDNEQDDEDDEQDEDSTEFGDEKGFRLGSLTGSDSFSIGSKTMQTEDVGESKPVTFFSILKHNAPEWKIIILGCFGSALNGALPFLYGICMGGIFDTLGYDAYIDEENEKMKDDSRKWALVFMLLGVESGIGVLLQNWLFAMSGERLTKRLRRRAFLAFLRQDIAYFDNPRNSTGALCSRLSSEVSAIQGATGSQLGLVVSAAVSVTGTLIVAFLNSWRLSLVLVSFSPVMLVAGLFMMDSLGSSTRHIAEEDAGQVAEETFSNIQTIASLGREEEFFERYRGAMAEPYRKAKKAVHFAGLSTGSTMCIVNLSFAASFRYGGKLITDGDITLQEMMTTIFTFLAAAVVVGQTSSLTPDYSKARRAAQKVFSLLDAVPSIDCQSDEGVKPEKCAGEVQMVNVRFRYPSRRKIRVLRNLNITVKPGQTVALVGTSGCGKSTTVSLVERFYDVNAGSVTLDGNDVKALNVKWLRRQIGIVSQEPVLFDVSIRENIAFGDTTRHVSDKEIEEAARSANIDKFIANLPRGYDTVVGDKGTLISGGQKQRIAIARALIRDPKILLLDEATSALDTESEKVVQQALDNASVGRTTLVIAHRLSTIQHADSIVVIRKGKAVERGTHQQLLALKGIYHALHKVQSMAKKQE